MKRYNRFSLNIVISKNSFIFSAAFNILLSQDISSSLYLNWRIKTSLSASCLQILFVARQEQAMKPFVNIKKAGKILSVVKMETITTLWSIPGTQNDEGISFVFSWITLKQCRNFRVKFNRYILCSQENSEEPGRALLVVQLEITILHWNITVHMHYSQWRKVYQVKIIPENWNNFNFKC